MVPNSAANPLPNSIWDPEAAPNSAAGRFDKSLSKLLIYTGFSSSRVRFSRVEQIFSSIDRGMPCGQQGATACFVAPPAPRRGEGSGERRLTIFSRMLTYTTGCRSEPARMGA